MEAVSDSTATSSGDCAPTAPALTANAPADPLAYATRFTFDGNRVGPEDRRWHPDLVVTVERATPGEWRVVQPGLVFNHRTGRWNTTLATRTAADAAQSAFLMGRDEAVRVALALVERIRSHGTTASRRSGRSQ